MEMSEKTCVVCGRSIRTGWKYCYEHRNTRSETSNGIGDWTSQLVVGIVVFFISLIFIIKTFGEVVASFILVTVPLIMFYKILDEDHKQIVKQLIFGLWKSLITIFEKKEQEITFQKVEKETIEYPPKIPQQVYREPYCKTCLRKVGGLDVRRCSYCGEIFCLDHSLPEKHECSGNPKAPPGGLREIHSGGSIGVCGK